VYEDTAKDNYDIYIMNMDGSGQKNITNTPGVEWTYLAYNGTIFFISDRDTCHRCFFLYEMDTEGNQVKKITNLQLEDSWMGLYDNGVPTMIVTGRIGTTVRQQFFTINILTGQYKQLTFDTTSYKSDPIFLPGGNAIVFRYRPDRKLRKTVPDELWIMNSIGGQKKQLTHFPKEDTTTEWFEYHAGPPQWSRKHGFITYLSRQKKQTQIYAINLAKDKQWQITSGDLSSGWHSWSNDGKWLVMDKSSHEGRGFNIHLMNYKTKKTIQLTNNWKTEQAPVFVEIK
jgi:TolB protein